MPKAILQLKDIRKEYDLGKTKVVALKGVDLEVDEGEFTVVTGPSGSGKTTLLNIIGCLDRASGGSYKLDGEEVGTSMHEAGGGLREAVAVGVGLDHRDVTHVARERGADEVEISLEGSEVDFSPATERKAGMGVHGRRRLNAEGLKS